MKTLSLLLLLTLPGCAVLDVAGYTLMAVDAISIIGDLSDDPSDPSAVPDDNSEYE